MSSNLPPGCGKLPGEEDEGLCEVCGRMVEDCICPECPVCRAHGDPHCYPSHGLEVTVAQELSRAAAMAMIQAENEALQASERQREVDEQLAYAYWQSQEN